MHQHAHIGQGGGQGAGNDGGRTNNKNPKNQTNAAQQGGGQGGGVSHNSSQGDAAHGQYANYANPYNMRDQQGMWQYGAAGQWGGQQNMQFQQQGVSPSPGVGYGSGVAQQGGNPSRQANGSYRGGNPSGSG